MMRGAAFSGSLDNGVISGMMHFGGISAVRMLPAQPTLYRSLRASAVSLGSQSCACQSFRGRQRQARKVRAAMHKPVPLVASVTRKHCPICGMVAYSQGGVHPQCAQNQADSVRMKRLRAKAAKLEKTAKAKPDASLTLEPWHKRCPKCRAQVHIRKSVCTCGHTFADKIRSRAASN